MPDLADAFRERLRQAEAERLALAARLATLEEQVEADRTMIVDLMASVVLNQERTAEMEQALKSSRTIGAAIGIIMESRQVTPDEAFDVLKQASQDHNRKLREIAEDLVAAHSRH